MAVIAMLALAGCGGKSKKESSAPPPPPKTTPSAAGSTASTPSGQTVALAVRVTPPKAGSAATVTYAALIASRTGAKPAPVDQITFRAQSGFKLNADKFPTCSAAKLKAGHASACAKAKVGDGSAQVVPPKGKRIASKISTFNGGVHGSRTTLLYLVETPGYSPLTAAATVEKSSGGQWGYSITYPPISKALPLAALQLRTLDRTVKSGGKTVHFIETPSSCGGSWKFDSHVSFRSGEKLTIPATATCSS
jgi:hypothetical protein